MPKANDSILKYYLPKPDKPHTVIRIPGSHTLYVGPSSCTRRHALRAMKYGGRENISFYFISEADVISGGYEDQIVSAVGDLLEILEPRPHILFIAVFCIDDFLGTDETALTSRLRETYPDVKFAFQHIDPVSLSEKKGMGMLKQKTGYSFIEPGQEKDQGINFLGNFTSLPEGNEFPKLLDSWGMGPIREIFTCRTYEEYQDMGKSRLSIVFRQMSQPSAQYMKEALGIPYYLYTGGYRAGEVARCYEEIAALLGRQCPDLRDETERISALARQTAKDLDGLPIAVDSSASLTPYDTARALLEYGFHVKYVFHSTHKFKMDITREDWLRETYPDLILATASDSANLCRGGGESQCLAIGSDCARVLRSAHFADVWHDEGYFGFQGIERFMETIRSAAATPTDWSKVPELKLKKEKT